LRKGSKAYSVSSTTLLLRLHTIATLLPGVIAASQRQIGS
jgi:hypothetical protein